MATFFEDLWKSIFTPGPTSTLLVATNAAFAGLQLILLVLLIATYSIHFAILSVLCGGLWGAINWFAKEVRAIQAQEEENTRAAGTANDQGKSLSRSEDERGASSMDSGDDTADEKESRSPGAAGRGTQADAFNNAKRSAGTSPGSAQGAVTTTGAVAGLAPSATDDTVRQRRSLAESTGDLSTDSEWEKVDDE